MEDALFEERERFVSLVGNISFCEQRLQSFSFKNKGPGNQVAELVSGIVFPMMIFSSLP